MNSGGRVSFVAIAMLAGGGCSTIQPRDVFREVQQLVAGRTSAEIVWNQSTDDDAAVEQRIKELLQQPLVADSAVQIALLNNRNLQATYEDLGLAQADLVQAGLLKNPVLSIERRFAGKALEIDVAQALVDLVMIPLRRRIAGAALEAARLRVTQTVLDLGADVRAAAFILQGAEQLVAMHRTVVDTMQASADLAHRMHQAGNITDLDLRMEQRLEGQALLDLAAAGEEVIQHRERLNSLMGLWGSNTAWSLVPRLPELPSAEISRQGLESLAVTQRLDLAAARQDIVTSAETLGLTRALRFVSSVEVASHYEREPEGSDSVGPSVHIAIPVFDWGQGAVPRDRALLRQKQERFMALAVEIRAQVRTAYSRMQTARDRADFYRSTVLPLQADILERAQLQYNAMILGPLHLFQLKQGEIEAGREYIESVRDYWVARTELERAVGGRITSTDAGAAAAGESLQPSTALASPAPADQHRH